MKCMIINIGKFAEVENPHTATDVNPYDIGDNLVAEIACKTDDTTRTSVNVRHNSDFLVREYVNREQFLYLLNCRFLDVVCEDLHIVSVYGLHVVDVIVFVIQLFIRGH